MVEVKAISGCSGCDDWVKCGATWICDYAHRHGHSRSLICRPGKYCTVKSYARGKDKRAGRGITWDEARAIEVYKNGGSDADIARAVGVSRKVISAWRKRRNMPTNWNPGGVAQ